MRRTYILGAIVALVSLVLFAWSLAAGRSQVDGSQKEVRPVAVDLKASQPASTNQNRAVTTTSGPSRLTGKPVVASSNPGAAYSIEWQVISNGGGPSISASYQMNSTIGQTAVGAISSGNYRIYQGFWQAPGSCCLGTTGNTDGSPDDVVDISDVFAVVDYLGSSLPLANCAPENDVNKDGTIDISDLFALIDYLSGAAPLPMCP